VKKWFFIFESDAFNHSATLPEQGCLFFTNAADKQADSPFLKQVLCSQRCFILPIFAWQLCGASILQVVSLTTGNRQTTNKNIDSNQPALKLTNQWFSKANLFSRWVTMVMNNLNLNLQ